MRAQAFLRRCPLAVVLATACTGVQASPDTGIAEPLRIESGQFTPGALPGSATSTADGGVNPQVTDVGITNTIVEQGEIGLLLSGHATTDTQAIAVAFADMGTGYWVVPVGAPDPTDNGLLTWQMAADFGRDLPPGNHNLAFAAIAPDGSSGTQFTTAICLDTPVPDNDNVCVPKRNPPAAVLSLSWDTPVSLDLVVQTPSGGVIGGSSSQGTTGTNATTSGAVIDHVSNLNCVIDNIDREDVVWQAVPATGTYDVWVDLFSACGKSAVSFTVSLWLAETQKDGTERLVEQQPPIATGVLTSLQANGGSGPGLYVGDFVLR